VDFLTVEPQFRLTIPEPVNRLVFFEAVTLEAKAFGEFFDLGSKDEVNVFFSEVAFALRAVDGMILLGSYELEHELPLTGRTLEDLG